MCDVPSRDITRLTPIISTVFMTLAICASAIRAIQWLEVRGIEDIFVVIALVRPSIRTLRAKTKAALGERHFAGIINVS